MIKNILALIGAIVLLIGAGAYIKMGSAVEKLDAGALPAYMDMFNKVLKDGDPAKSMMKEFKVEEDVSGDDVKESITALVEEYNMRLTGYVKMFTKEDAKPDEVKEARIYSLCSLPIAHVFLNHSRYFGGFMPCRIMYVQYGNGDAYLITMDLTLAIHGGFPLDGKMSKMAQKVDTALTEIPERAAKGDF